MSVVMVKKWMIFIGMILIAPMVGMAQRNDENPLFEQKNLKVFLVENDSTVICLRKVALYPPRNLGVFWGSEMDEEEFRERNIAFTLLFRWDEKYIRKTTTVENTLIAVAHFGGDSATYKVYEASLLEDTWVAEKMQGLNGEVFGVPQQICSSPIEGTYSCIGTSDDERLLAVKVWKYVQRQQAKAKTKKSSKKR